MSEAPFQQPLTQIPQGPPRPVNPQNDIVSPIVSQIRNIIFQLRDENISKISRDLTPKLDDLKGSVMALGTIISDSTSTVSKPNREIRVSSPTFYGPVAILTLIAILTATGFYISGINVKKYFDTDTLDQDVIDNMLIGTMVFFAGITLTIILMFAMLIYIINSL